MEWAEAWGPLRAGLPCALQRLTAGDEYASGKPARPAALNQPCPAKQELSLDEQRGCGNQTAKQHVQSWVSP